MFCSVRQLAKEKGVSPQAILEGISLGRYEAIQVGHDWRIFGVGGNYGKIQRTRTCRRRTEQIRINHDSYRAVRFSSSLEESSAGSVRKGESQSLSRRQGRISNPHLRCY